MRAETIFKVERYGGKWAVIVDDEALVLTETEADAARIAQGAMATLMSPGPPKPTPLRAPVEARSFSRDEGDERAPFGFPALDDGDAEQAPTPASRDPWS